MNMEAQTLFLNESYRGYDGQDWKSHCYFSAQLIGSVELSLIPNPVRAAFDGATVIRG